MPRQPTEAETIELLLEVQPYLNLPLRELSGALDDSIDEADSAGLPHRGISDKEFWEQYVARIKRELLQQRVAASATAGFAASKAIALAHEVGLDLSDYRIPIAIAVAIAVKSFWDQMSADADDKDNDGTVDGDTDN